LNCVSREGRGSEFTFTIPLRGALSEPQAHTHTLMDMDSLHIETPEPLTPEILTIEDISIPIEATEPETQENRPLSNENIEPPPTAPAQPDFVDLMIPSDTHPGLHDRIEPEPLQSTAPSLRVLVVDDMVSNRDVLSLMLESKGYICREAADGYAALAALERQPFDFIILDIHMAPLDGIETLRRIRASGSRYANIPVIALTADNASRINALLRNSEATRILSQKT